MRRSMREAGRAAGALLLLTLAGYARGAAESPAPGAEVTLKGSLICNGACIPDPKEGDHVPALFAIDGTPEIRSEVDKIMKEFYPERGLDGDAAQKLMDQFGARLKFLIDPDSPALKASKNGGKNHYCQPAAAMPSPASSPKGTARSGSPPQRSSRPC